MSGRPIQALIEYRLRESKTLEDLCRDLLAKRGFSTTRATLSRIEKGKLPLSREMLLHLHHATGLTVEQLDPEFARATSPEEAA